MSFARATLPVLIARIRADLDGRLPGADSRLSRSLLDVLARVEAGAVDGLYAYLGSIALDLMPDTADAEHLDRWASIWGVQRKGSGVAGGTVLLAGVSGAIVPANAVLLRADGTRFDVAVQTALVAGAASVTVSAELAGAAANSDAGTRLTFASPAAGVGALAVVGGAALTGGADAESDGSLRARFLARIQTPPGGGAASDWRGWALDQPEVTRAWVYPAWLGAGSVGVAVMMDARGDIFPGDADCARIAAALEPVRPVTAALTVFAPTPYPTPFSLHLTPDTPATRAAVLAELADLYAREASPGGTMLISRVREAVAVASGVADYRLAVPAADIVAPRGCMPVVGEVAFT